LIDFLLLISSSTTPLRNSLSGAVGIWPVLFIDLRTDSLNLLVTNNPLTLSSSSSPNSPNINSWAFFLLFLKEGRIQSVKMSFINIPKSSLFKSKYCPASFVWRIDVPRGVPDGGLSPLIGSWVNPWFWVFLSHLASPYWYAPKFLSSIATGVISEFTISKSPFSTFVNKFLLTVTSLVWKMCLEVHLYPTLKRFSRIFLAIWFSNSFSTCPLPKALPATSSHFNSLYKSFLSIFDWYKMCLSSEFFGTMK